MTPLEDPHPTTTEIASAIASFKAALRQARHLAGDPSYRKIARRHDFDYSISTITRALNGETLPPWDVTAQLLRAFGHQDTSAWRREWGKIANLRDPHTETPTGEPAGGNLPTHQAPGAECGLCGSWITNMALHQAWHTMFVPRLAAVPTTAEPGRPTPHRRTG